MKRSKLYCPGKALTHQVRSGFHVAAGAYRLRHDQLPGGGYVVFYHGKACGWTTGIQGRPEGWLADCVAVPADQDGLLHVAVGGTYLDGAERWEAIVP